MAYRMGFCPQCGTQIMTQDTARQWHIKPNLYRQLDLVFGPNTLVNKVRTMICSTCIEAPDLTILMDSILNKDSQATNADAKSIIENSGIPISTERVG